MICKAQMLCFFFSPFTLAWDTSIHQFRLEHCSMQDKSYFLFAGGLGCRNSCIINLGVATKFVLCTKIA